MITLRRTTSADPAFAALTARLDDELRATYGAIQDEYAKFNVLVSDAVVIAERDGVPVGCGCWKPFDASSVELKRMYVDPAARGARIAAAVLAELEQLARERGYTRVVLETGTRQDAAVHLYERCGYTPIERFGPYVGLDYSLCFGKALG